MRKIAETLYIGGANHGLGIVETKDGSAGLTMAYPGMNLTFLEMTLLHISQ